jgi:hypothetical protein
LGPTICKTLSSFEKGYVTEPLFYQNGFYIIKLINHVRPNIDQSFYESIKEKVLFDYQNEKDDVNFKDYIQYLKDKSEIIRYSLND